MEQLFCKKCHSFIIEKDYMMFCSKCGTMVGKIDGDDDVCVSLRFNMDPEIIKTISEDHAFDRVAMRLSHDPTCMLVDNQICPKCHEKARFIRDNSGKPLFVCSNCRRIL